MESEPRIELPPIYQHPLAYLLGLEGIALLHAFAGAYDRGFTMARLDEIRALLDSVEDLGDGTTVHPISATEGYGSWAEFYDEAENQLIDVEQPIVREILDGLPRGVALDAACGTGRHSAYLAALGHTVIGVDASSAMLERARQKVPDGEFRRSGAGLRAITLRLLFPSAFRFVGAKSPGGPTRWSTTGAWTSTAAKRKSTFPVRRRISGRSIAGVPPRPTRRIAASRWPSSGTSNAAEPELVPGSASRRHH